MFLAGWTLAAVALSSHPTRAFPSASSTNPFATAAHWMEGVPAAAASAVHQMASEGAQDWASLGRTMMGTLQGGGGTFPGVNVSGLPQPVAIPVPSGVTTGRKIIPDADHPFRAPGPGDQRGGCPGLNLMANYGYISRNGIVTPTEILYGMQEMLGFSFELAAAFAAFFFVSTIDITTLKCSIGHADARTDGPFTFLFGRAPGLFDRAAHGAYEVDGSVAYVDSYFADGDGARFGPQKWAEAAAIAQRNNGLWDINWAGEMRWTRYQQCISQNPQCYWGWKELLFYAGDNFPSVIAPSADSSGAPSTPSYDVAAAFWGVSGSSNGTYTPTPSHLQPGPDGNWYRRSPPLSVTDLATRALKVFEMHPVSFGGNNGRVNSFTSIGSVDGVAHPFCLISNALDETVPAYLRKYQDAAQTLARMFLAPLMSALGCQS